MNTKRFQFTSLSGIDFGVYPGATAEEAFRAMEDDGGGSAGDLNSWIIREVISRSAAKKQAHRESHMYRQGGGWIVSTWDDAVRCNRTSGEEPFQVARQGLADWRARRVAFLTGLER